MYRSFSIPRRTFHQLARQANIAVPAVPAVVSNEREKTRRACMHVNSRRRYFRPYYSLAAASSLFEDDAAKGAGGMVNRAKQGGRDRYWKSTRSRYERRNESVRSNVSSYRCCVRVCMRVSRVTCFRDNFAVPFAWRSDALLGLRTTVLFHHSLLAAGRSRGPPLLLLSHVYPRAEIHFRQQLHRARQRTPLAFQ